MHTRELQPCFVGNHVHHIPHNSCTRAKCNERTDRLKERVELKFHAYARSATLGYQWNQFRGDLKFHAYARSATATYCAYYFNSRIFCDSISNIYFVLPILRHILPISYTSLVRISQCFYEYLYFAQGGLCLRPLY